MVFAQHKSIATLALKAAVIVNAVMFTAMHVVTTFVHVYMKREASLIIDVKELIVTL